MRFGGQAGDVYPGEDTRPRSGRNLAFGRSFAILHPVSSYAGRASVRKTRRLLFRLVATLLVVALPYPALPQTNETTNPVVTVDNLKEMYPTSQLRQVSMDEFRALTNNPATHAVTVIAPDAGPRQPPSPHRGYRSGREHSPSVPDPVCVDFINFSGTFDVGNDEMAVVIFVVIGVIVVAAAIVYAGVFISSVLLGDWDEVEGWSEVCLNGSFFSGEDRNGGMYGLRFAGGFSTDTADAGLAVEVGSINGRIATRESGEPVDISTAYGIIGPTVRWVMDPEGNPISIDVDLLTGMAGDDNLDLLSRASVGVSWGIGSHWRLGFGIGALYLKVRRSEGLVSSDNEFNLVAGVQTGARF